MQQERYSMALRAIHWLTLLLVIVAFASIELRELFEKGTELRNGAKWIHFQFGALIFLVTLARIVFKIKHGSPAMVPMAQWQTLAAKVTLAGLYLCMLLMPLLGLTVLAFEQKDVSVLGVNMLNLGFELNKELAHDLEEIHETLGNVFLLLIGLHTVAAIWHHKIAQDNTLLKMALK